MTIQILKDIKVRLWYGKIISAFNKNNTLARKKKYLDKTK
jgi:hypothetical protein